MEPRSGDGTHRMHPGEHAWFSVEQIGACVVVTVSGELDLQTSDGLRDAADVAGEFSHRIVVDLTHVTFIDPRALAVLVEARNRAVAADGNVALVGLTDTVQAVLDVTGLNDVFPTYARVADAVAELSVGRSDGPDTT